MKTCLIFFLFVLICNVSLSQEVIKKTIDDKSTVFKFHPNPAQDVLYLLGANKVKTIELINSLGKREAIYHYNKSIIKMDLSELKYGIYLIKVTDENGNQETKRLIVE